MTQRKTPKEQKMSEDICERLEKNFEDKYPAWIIQGEAKETIEKLRSENDELRDLGLETHKKLTSKIDVASNLADGLAEMKKENDELKKANEWRDIDSAPKDGTEIMVYPVTSKNPTDCIAFWKEKYSVYQDGGAWLNLGDEYNSPGWLEGQADLTHWMPLPSAPK